MDKEIIAGFCKPCQFYETDRPCRVVASEPMCQLYWAQRGECKRASMFDMEVILHRDSVVVPDGAIYSRTDLEGIKKAAEKWKEQHPVLQFNTADIRTGIKF
jgi:hypothetical protein